MQPDQNVIKLIDKAVLSAGSKSKLARALGVPPQTVNDWVAGFRTCVPEDRARIAAMAKEDPLQELVRSLLEKHAGTLRGDQLKQVLGKWLHQTGGVIAGVLAGLTSGTYLIQNVYDIPRCVNRTLITT